MKLKNKLLTREVKIKPLTLFFIDNIEEYRNQNGYIRKTVEQFIEAEIKELLKTEKAGSYKTYLETTMQDLSLTHAGYFSIDNTEKDEAIEKEINEILHDKQAMLDLEKIQDDLFFQNGLCVKVGITQMFFRFANSVAAEVKYQNCRKLGVVYVCQ